jgi:signal transduction histidine kinase
VPASSITGNDKPQFSILHAALQGEVRQGLETAFVRPDGHIFQLLLSLGPLSNARGEVAGGIITLTDITVRKQAEQALQQARNELEQRVQERTAALRREMAERQRLEGEAQRAQHFALLGRLAAGVSHEIRNPLGAIFLHVDLLEEELQQPSSESPAQIAQALFEIRTQMARLDELVQDYLSLVRVSHIQLQSHDLGVSVQAWSAEIETQVAARSITLRLKGVENLGRVAFHASTLRRAVLNLLQNALDAMPNGGTLSLACQSTATQVQLQVRDTGSGIPAERLGRIFEPLYTTKPGGTGLGLYIVQEIVAAHGGQIAVQSVENQGTTFIMTLPRAPAEAPIQAELSQHADHLGPE